MREPNYYSYHVTTEGEVYNKWGARLKPGTTHKGYLNLRLTVAPYKKINKTIHRLVAEIHIPNPYRLSDVDHIDCDRTNNHISNLRWLSHGENIKHSFDSGRRTATGERNARSILKEWEVRDICTLFVEGYKPKHLEMMGYPYQLLSSIRTRRNWKSISKDYSF